MSFHTIGLARAGMAALALVPIAIALSGCAPIQKQLWDASFEGQRERVEQLIANGADVNARDADYGSTALMLAAVQGHADVVELLIAKGADVNAKDDKHGAAALMFAGNRRTAELLIANGADIEARGKGGETALMSAALRGDKELAELLIAKRADVNARSEPGYTALMVASVKGHREIAGLLIANGADLNASAKDGKTALLVAHDGGMLELLQRHEVLPACAPLPPEAGPLFDGLYQAAGEAPSQWYYLRFYPDGTALSASSSGTPQQVARWLRKESAFKDSGCVTMVSGKFQFATSGLSSAVEYSGSVQGDGLALHMVSRANGHVSDKLFRFNPVQF